MSQDLDLLFLGSGNAFTQGRYWSSFLLNGRFLFDASPVALPHLKQAGIPPEEVEAVFISHFHADHFFGLPFLMLEYAEMGKRSSDLTILGPPGIEERVQRIIQAGYPHLQTKEKNYREVYRDLQDGLEGEVADLKFRSRSVIHVDDLECFGFRVQLGERILAYSGDAVLCDPLLELADGADVFVVECSCWEPTCGPHMSPNDIRELRRELGPKPVFILTHLNAGQPEMDIENVLIAEDMARFSL